MGLSAYDAGVITSSKGLADFFDKALIKCADAKSLANWVMGDFTRLLKANEIIVTDSPITPGQLAEMVNLIEQGTISGKIAKNVIEEMFATGKDTGVIVKEKGLAQISNESALIKIIDEVLAANPASVEDYRAGKERAIGFLVGQGLRGT